MSVIKSLGCFVRRASPRLGGTVPAAGSVAARNRALSFACSAAAIRGSTGGAAGVVGFCRSIDSCTRFSKSARFCCKSVLKLCKEMNSFWSLGLGFLPCFFSCVNCACNFLNCAFASCNWRSLFRCASAKRRFAAWT